MKKTILFILSITLILASFCACGKTEPPAETPQEEQRTNMFGYANPSDDVEVKSITLGDSTQEYQLFSSDVYTNGGTDMLGTKATDWSTSEFSFSINSENITVTQSYSEKVGIYTYTFMYDNINYCLVSKDELPVEKLGETFGELFVEIGAM